MIGMIPSHGRQDREGAHGPEPEPIEERLKNMFPFLNPILTAIAVKQTAESEVDKRGIEPNSVPDQEGKQSSRVPLYLDDRYDSLLAKERQAVLDVLLEVRKTRE